MSELQSWEDAVVHVGRQHSDKLDELAGLHGERYAIGGTIPSYRLDDDLIPALLGECGYTLSPRLRLRILSARHPYGGWSWAYEILDPSRTAGHQIVSSTAWFASWRQAWTRGSAELRSRLGHAAA